MQRNRYKPSKTPKGDDLAELLVRCRAERGMSLEAVAQAVGLTARGISKIERGEVAPRRTTRNRLEEFLRKHNYYPKAAA
jgi:transcriptional regulator with XRE-family HTH domain